VSWLDLDPMAPAAVRISDAAHTADMTPQPFDGLAEIDALADRLYPRKDDTP
jgi:hypothetical protein